MKQAPIHSVNRQDILRQTHSLFHRSGCRYEPEGTLKGLLSALKGSRKMENYVFYGRRLRFGPSSSATSSGDRVVEVAGREYAPRQAAEQYGPGGAVLLRSSTDFHPISNLSHPDAAPRSSA